MPVMLLLFQWRVFESITYSFKRISGIWDGNLLMGRAAQWLDSMSFSELEGARFKSHWFSKLGFETDLLWDFWWPLYQIRYAQLSYQWYSLLISDLECLCNPIYYGLFIKISQNIPDLFKTSTNTLRHGTGTFKLLIFGAVF